MAFKQSVIYLGAILIVFTLIKCEREEVNQSNENHINLNEETFKVDSKCTDRDQLEIQHLHLGLATELSSTMSQSLPEADFKYQVSKLLDKMYKNFCEGETLTFHGIIGDIDRIENTTNLMLRIDDMISTDQSHYLFIYQTAVPMFRGIGWDLVTDFGTGDPIQFEFSIGTFLEPNNRSEVLEVFAQGESGSFPIDRISDGVHDTFPSGEYIIFPIPINITELTSIVELFTQHRREQETFKKNNEDSEYKRRAQKYYENALVLENDEDFKNALNYLNQAIELNPYFAEAYEARGIIRYVQEDFQEALKDLEKAIEFKSTLEDAYVILAMVKMSLGYGLEEICKDLARAKDAGSDAPLVEWEMCQ